MTKDNFQDLLEQRSTVLLDIIKQRRSVRKFNPDPVKKEDILAIVEAAAMAPSATNAQNWQFIAVETETKRKELADAIRNQINEYSSLIKSERAFNEFNAYSRYFTFFDTAPLVLCVIKTPYASFSKRIMKRYGLSTEALDAADAQGPSAAIQNILLAAHAMGYGACWMTGPLVAKEKLEKVLNLAPDNHLMAIIPIGKTDAMPEAPKRKPMDEVFVSM